MVPECANGPIHKLDVTCPVAYLNDQPNWVKGPALVRCIVVRILKDGSCDIHVANYKCHVHVHVG